VDSWDIRTLDLQPHQPQVLRTDAEARVVAINLPAGEAQVGPVGSPQQAGPGFLAHFDPNERHEVRAISDTRLILFLAPWPGEGHPSQR